MRRLLVRALPDGGLISHRTDESRRRHEAFTPYFPGFTAVIYAPAPPSSVAPLRAVSARPGAWLRSAPLIGRSASRRVGSTGRVATLRSSHRSLRFAPCRLDRARGYAPLLSSVAP